jgi:mercuric ion transport protein
MATAGSVVSGVLASACCIGPLVLGLLGISGAAFAQRLEPFRPYLLVMTYALLGGAFYLAYRPQAACGPGEACEMPRANRVGRIMLWIAAIVVVLATAFPWYAQYLPF